MQISESYLALLREIEGFYADSYLWPPTTQSTTAQTLKFTANSFPGNITTLAEPKTNPFAPLWRVSVWSETWRKRKRQCSKSWLKLKPPFISISLPIAHCTKRTKSCSLSAFWICFTTWESLHLWAFLPICSWFSVENMQEAGQIEVHQVVQRGWKAYPHNMLDDFNREIFHFGRAQMITASCHQFIKEIRDIEGAMSFITELILCASPLQTLFVHQCERKKLTRTALF